MKLPADGVLESLKQAPVDDPIIAAGLPAVPASDMEAPDELGTPSLVHEANKLANGKKPKKKITFAVPEEEAGRMRAAFMAEAATGKVTSFSEWIVSHLMDTVHEVEKRVNNGQAFTPLQTDVIPKGRR